MASSSDTRSNRIWLTSTHVALLWQGSAAANNLHIRRVSVLDSRNSRGYNTLVYVPPEGGKPWAVTIYQGQWCELHHDRTTGHPYLGPSREDIHEHNGPINNKSESGSDEEAGLPQLESESESDTDTNEDTARVRNSPITSEPFHQSIQLSKAEDPPRIIKPLCKVPSPVQTRFTPTNKHVLPPPATQCSSIATLSAKQSRTTMSQTTTITTTQTNTSQPQGAPAAPAPVPPARGPTPEDQVWASFHAALRQNGGPPGSNHGGGGGPPGRGPPGWGQPGGGAAAPVTQVPVPPTADVQSLGALPRIFSRNRAKAPHFMEELLGYFRSNTGVTRFDSPIWRVTIALTFIKGKEVFGWACDMGRWIDQLHPVDDNILLIWEQFLHKFERQFEDSQQQQQAQLDLETCKMCFPDIDQYIATFEELARQAGYIIGNGEMISFFLKGLIPSILEDIMKPPFITNYVNIKQCAVDITKAKQLIEGIRAHHRIQPTHTFQNMFGQQRQCQPFFSRGGQNQTQQRNNIPQYNLSNVPRQYNNTPVPMDIGCSRFPNNCFNNRNRFNNRLHQPRANATQYDKEDTPQDKIHAVQTDQLHRHKGPCFNCGKMGHFTAQCRGGTRVNYMDTYKGEDQIPPPNIKPRINVAHIKAQINMLSP